ncbi:serine hydrolase [Streptomyces collinus]|uniref:serine hydrolase n=1 Tax=Streptomyces collinus TaxID=42684 RepID=UPI002942768F|nr:serine hydrolase [Streptomyces collinus]
MPRPRALLSLPLLLALLLAPAAATGHATGATDPVLPLLVTRGGAPAAALLVRDGGRTRYTAAGRGIARADHFRAGSVTKAFVATVVLQLADVPDPRVAGAAGELVTTLDDLDRFHAALLGARLLPPRWLREMLNTRVAHGSYGMGLFPVELPCGVTVWGHNGRITGSYVRTAATVDGRRVLTFRVDTTEISDPGLEPRPLAAEFCPRTR